MCAGWAPAELAADRQACCHGRRPHGQLPGECQAQLQPILALLPVLFHLPNLMTIPDLCHQHLMGAPCMTLLLWVGPLRDMLSLVRHLGVVGVDPRAEQTRAITATESSLLPALFQALEMNVFLPSARLGQKRAVDRSKGGVLSLASREVWHLPQPGPQGSCPEMPVSCLIARSPLPPPRLGQEVGGSG